MTTAPPIDLAEVIGYSLCLWPAPPSPFAVPYSLDVYDTVDEAREVRNLINASGSRQVCIVQVRRVVIE